MKVAERVQGHGWLGPIRQAAEVPVGTFLADPGDRIQLTSVDPREALDILVSAYSSAVNQLLTLGEALLRVTDREQRRALYRLYALEVHRREVARLSAEAIWGIQLPEAEPDAQAA